MMADWNRVGCADVAQQLRLFGLTHNVYKINTIGNTNFLQHLPKVRRGRSVNQGTETFRRMVSTMPSESAD